MCLIIYAAEAALIPREQFWRGAQDNNDGIGIMSTDGVEKFLGRKMVRRAYAYARSLAAAGIPYGVHFRWATHGRVGKPNTHPFEIPGTAYWMMHNGILWTSSEATDDLSDTAIFARDVMPLYMDWKQSGVDDAWLPTLEKEADYSRLLLLNEDSGEFAIVNEDLGQWDHGFWYSNAYSFALGSKPKVRTVPKAVYANTYASPGTELPRWPFGEVPGPSGPGVDMRSDDERLEEWYYRTRAAEMRGTRLPGWGDYPLPGSWDDRHALAEDLPDAYDALDGVQQYV